MSGDLQTTNRPAPDTGASPDVPLTGAKLPLAAVLAVAVGAVALGALVMGPLGRGIVIGVVAGWVFAIVIIQLLSIQVEGRRRSKDRLMTILVSSAFIVALMPLLSLCTTVVKNGAPAFSTQFFTYSMRNVVGGGGGIYHALIGTLLITAAATVISVPIGVMTAVYLVEYGQGRLARSITTLVDVMTGIPSIVAGLFAYAFFAIFFGEGVRMGLMGSVALSVLMIPIVVRSCEEMLKLVPNELREASYALGISKWRTIVGVVLTTALPGIITGITLAIARIIGETAPLLIACGVTDSVNFNLFSDRMMTLPVFAFSAYATPSFPVEQSQQMAWGAALVLMILVLTLNLVARLISRRFSPQGKR
jgi:phosphate transport system permease protein